MYCNLRRRAASAFSVLVLFTVLVSIGSAQTVSGQLYHDIDRDGVQDPGEPGLAGVPVALYGNHGGVDLANTSDGSGSFQFSPPASALYAVEVTWPGDRRPSLLELAGDAAPIPNFPRGRRRAGTLPFAVNNLRQATVGSPYLHVGIGDSIAFGFNLCGSPFGTNGYLEPYTDRLNDVAAAASLNKIAVPGYETFELLLTSSAGNIFETISLAPDLVTISIGGNDFLGDDGNHSATAANIVAAKQNVQELISTLLTELPQCDVIVNTVYDNEDGNDNFHNLWAPLWNQMLRDVAWGQTRAVGIAEVWPEFSHLDPWTSQVVGEPDLICMFLGLDEIHPTNTGYTVHREKVWQATGGANVGASGDTLLTLGSLQNMESRSPTVAQDIAGGTSNPNSALTQDGTGALVPGGTGELHLSGFDSTARGLLAQVVVNVRYRTSALPVDDYYRLEASVDGTFSAPGSTASTWNTIVPIVGGAGNNGAEILAFPHQPSYRTVSTVVSQGAPDNGDPSLTWSDLANLKVRLKGTTVNTTDSFDVEWDAAWLDLYGVPEQTLLVRGSGAVGSQLQIDVTGPEGALCFLFLGAASTTTPFPPWGDLLVDLAFGRLLFLGAVGSTGACTLAAAVPNEPSLPGQTVYFQGWVVEDFGTQTGGLTNLASITFPTP
jgi:hypothetical protein